MVVRKKNIEFFYLDDSFWNHGNVVRPPTPDPHADDSDYEAFEKKHISDETLWKMFSTGASFRALSSILDLAFDTAGAKNKFFTSSSHLFKSYQQMLQSKETVYKHRIQEDQSYGTICFDHQATRKLTGKYEGTSHRLAIVWYSEKSHKVLGMPKMTNKTAESQAKAVRETCNEFGIQNQQISGVTCDNEITNIGVHGGTCTLMEYALNKTLLRLMCRLHILEIVIKDVYHHLFTSDTPNNLFYSALKESWSELREAGFPFEPFNNDSTIEEMGFDAYQLFTPITIGNQTHS